MKAKVLEVPWTREASSFSTSKFTIEKGPLSTASVRKPSAKGLTSFSITLEKGLKCAGNVFSPRSP